MQKTARPGRPRTGRIKLNITLPPEVRDQLGRVAAEEHSSISQIIERLVLRYFSRRP